jgi:hypothetical protein
MNSSEKVSFGHFIHTVDYKYTIRIHMRKSTQEN